MLTHLPCGFGVNSDLDGPMPTSRLAWREVRDHTAREADTRRAFVGALRESVVRDLLEVKEVQNRIRGRIKADLKMAEDVSDLAMPGMKWVWPDMNRANGTDVQ